jgi:hypothetical protein
MKKRNYGVMLVVTVEYSIDGINYQDNNQFKPNWWKIHRSCKR